MLREKAGRHQLLTGWYHWEAPGAALQGLFGTQIHEGKESKMKKFELVAEMSKEIFGKKLFRIRALISFGIVDKGDLGGWVEKEDNISQDGNAW
ncbi:TPA: hypothetical protein ACNGY0_005535, partial [Raoultella planticola]